MVHVDHNFHFSSICSSPSLQETISPRVSTSSSASRRRRKRKSSQSESRKQPLPSTTPSSPSQSCTSPVEQSKTSEEGCLPQTPDTSLDDSSTTSIMNEGATPVTPLSARSRREHARSNSSKPKRGTPKTKLLNKFALIASKETSTPLTNGVKSDLLEELTNKPQTWQVSSKQTSPPPGSPWTSFSKR